MTAPAERSVMVLGEKCRVWEMGKGPRVGFLGGLRGLPRWLPMLDRLAQHHHVIAPSLPGFPGATGHRELDTHVDWLAATLDVLEQSGLEGADLIGASVGGTLAAEIAAMSKATVSRLVLIAPFGLFDEAEPTADIWAQRSAEIPALISADPERLAAFLAKPDDEDPTEWQILLNRADESAARLLWPTGDVGIHKRLHRIRVPTLILTGAQDRVIPASYAKRFAAGVSGWAEVRSIEGAGHMAEVDQPDAVADAIHRFLSSRGA